MRRRVFFMMLPCLLAGSASARADAMGEGVVRMQGAIIDTPCAIAVDSREQSIEMPVLPVAQIMRDGRGPDRQFGIRLINCRATEGTDRKAFRITFEGEATGNGLFAVHGRAQGVGLQITDDAGNTALPGRQMPPVLLQDGTMQLNYTLRLATDNHTLRSGMYRAAIRFRLDYY